MGKLEEITKETSADAQGLIQMYQSGFLDGYNWRRIAHPVKFKTCIYICRKAFNKRFMKKIEKQIKHGSHIKQKT